MKQNLYMCIKLTNVIDSPSRTLLLEEYHPKIAHVKGVGNDSADCFSRNDLEDRAFDLVKREPPMERLRYFIFDDEESED